MRGGLQRVLEELRARLSLAALHAEDDVAHVHRLRVAARRGMTLVRVASDLLRPRDSRRLRRMLRKVRRAAGEARDLDVLLLQYGDTPIGALGPRERALLLSTRARRAAAQGPIEAIHSQLAGDPRRARREWRLLRRIERRGRGLPARAWAAARIGDAFRRFVAATPVDLADVEALHRYRLCAKDLRYALDELAPALPRRLVRELTPTVRELQDRIGDVHDHAVHATRYLEWAEGSSDPALGAHLRSLAEREREALTVGVQDLEAWWRPAEEARFLGAMAAGLERAAAR